MSFYSISRTRQRSKLYSQRHFYFHVEINFFWDGGLSLGLWKSSSRQIFVSTLKYSLGLRFSFCADSGVGDEKAWTFESFQRHKKSTKICKQKKIIRSHYEATKITNAEENNINLTEVLLTQIIFRSQHPNCRKNLITFFKFLQMTL